jgi:hypothetical protein
LKTGEIGCMVGRPKRGSFATGSAEPEGRMMSERAIAFVETWATENIDHQAEGGNLSAEILAAQCLAAAKAQGIPKTEIDDAFEDLTAFMAGQIAEAKDREEARLVAKNE